MTTKARFDIQRVALFGLGKAGNALYGSLSNAGIQCSLLGSRSKKSRDAFLKRHGKKATSPDLRSWFDKGQKRNVDAFFLALSDDALTDAVLTLDERAKNKTRVIHLSGAKGLAVFSSCSNIVGSVFHPLSSLSEDQAIPPGTFVGVMGPEPEPLLKLAKRCALDASEVQDRPDYHAGAVMSANLPLALLELGVDALERAGFPRHRARQALALLMETAAKRAYERPLSEALTGPVARGDAATVSEHLEALEGHDAELYRLLSQLLLNNSVLTTKKREALLRALSS